MQNLISYLESLNPKHKHFLGESSYELHFKKCRQDAKIIYGGSGDVKRGNVGPNFNLEKILISLNRLTFGHSWKTF